MSGLLLGRKVHESIMIGDDTEVTVERIRGDRVAIRVDAPKSMPVHRREVYEAIKAKDAAASATEQGKPTDEWGSDLSDDSAA